MKSRTIEIIDNHIEALEEELEWYQEKNREWQEKCENKQQYIIGGNLDNCFRITTVDELLAENARLREQLRWHSVSEMPRCSKHETISVDVMLKRPKTATVIAWHRYDRNEWWSYGKGQILVPSDSTWCYIPENKDGDE